MADKNFLIVGLGLSGLAICEELEKRGLSFTIFEDHSQKSSLVAGGIFNPVILKRFTLAWEADKQMSYSIPYYKELERKLHVQFLHFWNIYRRFHSVEEQNDWFTASDKEKLKPFLDTSLEKIQNQNISSDYSFGKVNHTGNVDTELMIASYRDYLQSHGNINMERLKYEDLKIEDSGISYHGGTYENIIFCEGFGINQNPFFQYLPLRGNKGEYITIHAPDLKLEKAIKASVFIMPMGNDHYKVGATYDNHDKTPDITKGSREKLEKELRKVVKCDFEVISQVAGIRPATIDRKPLVGRHPEYRNLFCCNGFGSRGVLIGPVMAKKLIDYIQNDHPLEAEIDLARFTPKYFNA